MNSPLGIYLIHNGNLTNTEELRDLLNSSRSFFNRHLRTDSDSEVLLNILADEVHRAHQRCLQVSSRVWVPVTDGLPQEVTSIALLVRGRVLTSPRGCSLSCRW